MTHYKIRIHATRPASSSAQTPFTWTVAVYVNGSELPQIPTIQDVATPGAKDEAQWYLEQYAQQDPFALSRARSVHKSLTQYAKNLSEQLQLEHYLSPLLNEITSDGTAPVVEIEVSEDELDHATADRTLHQLLWETLEDTSKWLPNAQVLVRRTIIPCEEGIAPIQRVLSWRPNEEPMSTLNLLLVVARDLSNAPSSYSDVTPSLASGVLAGIGQKISQISKTIRLNVEIVRPGTLGALEKHLEIATRDRAPGYFHIVHFDLHGTVRKAKGIKTAYLAFASPTSDRTTLVPATSVAKLLRKHKVSFAVLNSCESARANAGDDANIAKIFQNEDLQAVLAMSFKISSHAAEIFLTSFYSSFLLGGLGFSEAASVARKALRDNALRPSRFGLQREVLDWFVPVCYVRRGDVIFTSQSSATSATPTALHLSTQQEDMINMKEHRLFGREFDLLRLEKMLVKKRVVYVHGVLGVGKTALLKHASTIWEETSFFDVVIYLDVAGEDFCNAAQMVKKVLTMLLDAEKRKEKNESNILELQLAISGDDDIAAIECLKTKIQQSRVLMIFDRIHDAFSILQPEIILNSSNDAATSLNMLLSNIIQPTSAIADQHTPCLIFAGRKGYDWFGSHVDVNVEVGTFELQELQMSDSLDLAQHLLANDDVQHGDWVNSGLDQLESVVELLQHNPGTMCEVLSNLNTIQVPPQERHTFLRAVSIIDLFDKANDVSNPTPCFSGIHRVCINLRDEIIAVLMVISLYWHEAPQITALCDLITSSGICRDIDDIITAIHIAAERGWLSFAHGDAQIVWIHPMFTLCLRSIAALVVDIAKRERESNSALVSELGGEPNLQNQLPVSLRAARLICSTLSEHSTENSALSKTDMSEFRQKFLDALETQWWWKFLSAASAGIHVKDMSNFYLRGILNTLSSIDIITAWISDFPIQVWPHTVFERFSTHVKVVGTTAQKKICAEHFEKLMKTFISHYGYAVEHGQLYHILNLGNYLVWSHFAGGLSDSSSKRAQELHQLCLDVLTTSEREYNYSITEGREIYEKGYVIRLQALMTLNEGKYTEAVEIWRHFMVLDELWVQYLEKQGKENKEKEKLSDFSDFSDSFINREAVDKKQAAEMRQRLKSVLDFPIEKAYAESRKKALGILEAIAASGGNFGPDEWQGKIIPSLMAFNPGFKNVADVQEAAGLRGIEDDPRTWPENSDLVALTSRYDDRKHRLYALEDATDSGDWVKAAEHHQSLVRSALMSADFEDALEHATATMEIYQKDPTFASSLEQMTPMHSFLAGQESYMKSIVEDPTNASAERMSQAIPALTQMIEALKLNGAPAEVLESLEISRQMWATEAETGFERMVSIMQETAGEERKPPKDQYKQFIELITKRPNDKQYVNKVISEQAQIMRLFKKSSDLERTGVPEDMISALKILDQLESLASTDVGSIFINIGDIQGDRERFRCKHDSLVAISRWHEESNAERHIEALEQLEILTNLKETAKRIQFGAAYSTLDTMYVESERSLWNQMYTTAEAASAGSKKRIRLWTELLNRYRRNMFPHLAKADLAPLAKNISLNRLLDLALFSYRKHEWVDNIKHCDEWLKEAKTAPQGPEDCKGYDIVLTLKDTAEIAHHNNEYAKADQRFDFDEASKQIDIVEAITKRRAGKPDINGVVIDQSLVEQQMMLIRFQLNTKIDIIRRLGPVQGRRVIEEQRRQNGYKAPIV